MFLIHVIDLFVLDWNQVSASLKSSSMFVDSRSKVNLYKKQQKNIVYVTEQG